jgi:large subunit ribosomal protein L16
MLMPRRVKYRKHHKRSLFGVASGGTEIAFGEYGLKSSGRAYVTSRQIEAARISISRKPAETRMGKGKGEPTYWVSVVKPGRILFEIEGVPETLAREALRLAGSKFPMSTLFVKRPVL